MDTTVRDNRERSRFELYVDGQLAGFATYRRKDSTMVFPHTEIEPGHRGQGMGEVLVRGALDKVRNEGGRIVPACWFVARFVDDNPDYQDLLAA